MKPLAASPVRIARPSHDLRAAGRFWVKGLRLGGEVDEDLARRLVDAGGTRVSARNPYWDRWGITIADPDGYRLVLSSLSWP